MKRLLLMALMLTPSGCAGLSAFRHTPCSNSQLGANVCFGVPKPFSRHKLKIEPLRLPQRQKEEPEKEPFGTIKWAKG